MGGEVWEGGEGVVGEEEDFEVGERGGEIGWERRKICFGEVEVG